MPPARAALPALTVTELRAQLDRGATPRVRLRAGGTGTVFSVGDPDTDGPNTSRSKSPSTAPETPSPSPRRTSRRPPAVRRRPR